MSAQNENLLSSSACEVLGALWLRDKLNRIDHKLDFLLRHNVPPEKLVELIQVLDNAKATSDVLSTEIEHNR